MSKELIQSARDNMQKSIESYSKEVAMIKTGRANPKVLDVIRVDYYGFPTPLIEIAQVSVPEPRQIAIKPYEKESIGPIEKAILAANLGFTPINDGTVVRLNIPPLTEERRKEFVKLLGKTSEEAKVSVRNIRRRINDAIKDDKTVSEDQTKRELAELQKLLMSLLRRLKNYKKLKKKKF